MNTSKSRLERRHIVLGSLMVVVGCSWLLFRSSQQSASATPTLRVAAHTTAYGAPLVVAHKLGLFEKEGVTVDLSHVESSKYSLPAVQGGQLDIAIGTLAAGNLTLLSKSKDLRIFADGGRSAPILVLSQRISPTITPGSLSGRRIRSTREGSASYFGLSRVLASVGLTINDIKLVVIEGEPETAAALERGDLDGAIMSEPFATMATERGIGRRAIALPGNDIFSGATIQYMALFATRSTLDSGDKIARFMKGYLAGIAIYEDARVQSLDSPSRKQIATIIAGYTGSTADIVSRTAWPSISRRGALDSAAIQQMVAFLKSKQLIADDFSISPFLDDRQWGQPVK
jgi:ABC-type nitrate/sulfonate/bicarbonate transport system substrate-binding protein